ncbi:DNA cytosine methyltransferase [Deinococcus soli (ex Cha et al. 2016)]|uniref:DNA cytosine methyltransferase n=1 Tax=Deinococcus soli (ex Cha et al. 2016) TaxID=1309411 RepID=UPI001669B485|nr:DNA cytosine methyltransferase [Deinococcus soli (ex Cha et al. 2016)]GGB68896.1 hypothetical protein GCM10008019_26410 [Deinococcus soli (ex Cha et al. 2016)]
MKKNTAPTTYLPLFTHLGTGPDSIVADGEIVIVNFAGLGGACAGIEEALNRPVTVAINHDPVAISLHRTNNPHTLHHVQDVWAVDPAEVAGGRRIGLAWFSPDCFPAGTMVLTRTGYRPIEEIQVGDEVLTHQNRWRAVTEMSSAIRPLLRLRGHGHPGLVVSPEHPFYARRRADQWDNDARRSRRHLESADWMPASVLDKGWYWASPTQFPAASIPTVPVYRDRQTPITPELLWLAGRYLADGWTRLSDTRAELVLTCGDQKRDALADRLTFWEKSGADGMTWHHRRTDTAHQYSTNYRGLVEWLREHFGHGAAEKRLPGWALGMDSTFRQALLDGYVSGDGCLPKSTGTPITECTTVSKALAFSLKALVNSLGFTVNVYFQEHNTSVIQGRAVNTRPSWSVRWRAALDEHHRQTFREDGHEWAAIRGQEDLNTQGPVFNIGVEEDESYVVEGIVVHNCKHFSKAKGGTPVEKHIRDLAWVTTKYTALPDDIKPRVLFLENVEEFKTWGPLDEHGRPCKVRQGETFREFVATLEAHGYEVEHRELRACDYGAPTIRKRLFLIARCDGQPIVWPAPTHGNPKSDAVREGHLLPWKTAAECIDWDLPTPSIFARKRPLVPATLRRVARGIKKFVLDAEQPFIVTANHGGPGFRGQDVHEPMRTITAAHDAHGLVDPVLMPFINNKQHQAPARSAAQPLSTITTNHNKNELAAAYLVRSGHYSNITGEGSHFRGQGFDQPLSTVTAAGNDKMVTTAHLTKFRSGSVGSSLQEPIHTITAGGEPARPSTGNVHGLVSASLIKHFGGYYQGAGSAADAPVGTITANDHNGVLLANLVRIDMRGFAKNGTYALGTPLGTVTTKAAHALSTASLIQYNGMSKALPVDRPAGTLTTVERFGLTLATLTRHFGTSRAADVAAPLGTITTEGGGKTGVVTAQVESLPLGRFLRAQEVYALLAEYAPDALTAEDHAAGVVFVQVAGEQYVIGDIGMRMLTPRELARCQGFRDTYVLEHTAEGRSIPKSAQVRGVGNSVCPPIARALVEAQFKLPEAAD